MSSSINLDDLTHFLTLARTRVRQILANRFGVTYPNDEPLHTQRPAIPMPQLEQVEHFYFQRQEENRLNETFWNLHNPDQMSGLLDDLHNLLQSIQQCIDNEEEFRHEIDHRFAQIISDCLPAFHLMNRWSQMRTVIRQTAGRLFNMITSLEHEGVTLQREPHELLESVMGQLHLIAYQLDQAIEETGHTVQQLNQFLPAAEQQLARHREPGLSICWPQNHRETLDRLPIAIRQAELIVNRNPDAQPIHEYAFGLFQLINGFRTFYQRFRPEGYNMHWGGSLVTQPEIDISNRVTPVHNRLEECMDIVEQMYGATTWDDREARPRVLPGPMAGNAAVDFIRTQVLPSLQAIRQDAQLLSQLYNQLPANRR